MVSLNEHLPGRGQYRNIEVYKEIKRQAGGLGDRDLEQWVNERLGLAVPPEKWQAVAAEAKRRGAVLVSHDDDTEEKVDLMAAIGVSICEFPVTMAAARRARQRGMYIAMGAPNLLRGGSLTGNVGALELAAAGLLDVLSADYYAPGLLGAVFDLADRGIMPLHQAVALVSDNPARAAGLMDRGRLAPGLRADLVVASRCHGVPLVTALVRQGQVRLALLPDMQEITDEEPADREAIDRERNRGAFIRGELRGWPSRDSVSTPMLLG